MRKVEEYSRGGTGGFTLIEMLVVIAVISILAGIVLVGITGFQESARDTKRIADVRGIQNNLELYFTRCGNYPIQIGTEADPCDGSNAITTWADLATAFDNVGIVASTKVPDDARGGSIHYFYEPDGNVGSTYIVGASLENPSGALDDDDEIDNNADDVAAYPGVDLTQCDDGNGQNGFCVGLN